MNRKFLFSLKLFLILTAFLFLINCSNSSDKEWVKSTPEKEGFDNGKLKKMNRLVKKKYKHFYSILIIRNGKLVYEKYYKSNNKNTRFKLNSVTKTVTSALIGIALKEGFIESVDESITGYFPEYINDRTDPGMNKITIKNILTMTGGVNWNVVNDNEAFSNYSIYKEVWEKNPIQYFFSRNCINNPGETWEYSNLAPQVLTGILTKASKMPVKRFAEKYLFGPLGINRYGYRWESDPQNNMIAAWGLYLRARDMAKIGQLYLNKGAWYGRQVFSREWYDEATSQHSTAPREIYQADYGYLLWEKYSSNYWLFYASGTGGQYIFVVPGLKLVVVTTGKPDQEHFESELLMNDYIIPSLKKPPAKK